MSPYIIRQKFELSKKDRQSLKKHASFLIWFTGLSGSGKSTLANAVEVRLHELGVHTYPLDGDNIRDGINKNLKFSPEDRDENIRRVAEISKLFVDAGLVVLGSFISPFAKSREEIKEIVGAENFVEVFLNTSLEECERRDVKGLYKKARNGEIPSFTGISSPYEAPENPDVVIKTEELTVDEAADKVMAYISTKLALNE
ncbi:MAG: adenylyl-sulfate kinase [bacterium]|nr:adenylyl-sulfate kinase [bacterium]